MIHYCCPNRPESKRGDWIIAGFLGILHAVLVTIVYNLVPDPYMDEVFHIRQVRKYCIGDFTWDPMITTPPALYILAIPLCGWERYVNSFIFMATFVGFCRFRRMFANKSIYTSAITSILLPVLLHSSILFYTDLLSICTVVWGFSLPPLPSSVMFIFAVLTRQTNIVWAGMYAATLLMQFLNLSKTIHSVLTGLVSLWPFLMLALCFTVFVIINGGIVLGDPSAHQIKVHLSQFLYLALFCALHAWPHIIERTTVIRDLLKPSSLLLLISIIGSIHHFSFDHPYLLADNRHVPFYLWRWFLGIPQRRLTLAPIYLISLFFICSLSSHLSPLIRTLFVVCCLLVVIPAHLIEPRYFIIPYVLWRLSAKSSDRKSIIVAEILSQSIVFSIVLYLFLFRAFEWLSEPGVNQRFMW